MSESRLRKATNRAGAGLKAFIRMSEPGPAMVAALLSGTAVLFAIAYAIGNWL